MNFELKSNKQVLRSFMRANYTDEKLIQLLDHARADRLRFYSCCCFISTATADHKNGKLKGLVSVRILEAAKTVSTRHLMVARELDGAEAAEDAFAGLAGGWQTVKEAWADSRRRAILIPMILAEMKRRNQAPRSEQTKNKVEVLIER